MMVCTAWKGGTFGIRVGSKNAQQYFKPGWTHIEVKIGNNFHYFNLSTTFWTTCPEFRGKEIGDWLHRQSLAPWSRGNPPKLHLIPLGGNRFRLQK